ncbi:ABC transporter ATP-binding protein [Chelativorans intermedius]|uniref:ABC transporter ATP-binding protein n=1 Tax=Chelativorans intermedius TaxID=515947 RepID=A0ABV6DCN1_9HYPH|nr:sn-glycerol-3-phosphate ABC transporter ATP-binding protein UgpC [Chelativorans intermedius]MCT9000655.1 sn-glycerol-3-phosphate ABC transporter ATP-binding protein UgpC [Chelativorans intermedius]
MSNVSLRGLKKSYGSVEVIPSLDLDIRSGEFVVLVGPSGSGKSTLLRMIAGLESIDAGTVSVEGEDVTQRDPGDRDMAMVFQSYALYPHMTVAENMTFALRMRGMDKTTIGERLTESVRMLSLEGLEHRKPGQLSGGQRQRVAMGRAIVRQPRVFLFDEPLSNLDAKLRARTRIELRELHEKLGATSIFVTHDQIEAMTMADRIVLLEKGRIQQVGSPREIYERPRNTFVASFIGSPEINMMEGKLWFDNGTAWFEQLVLRSRGSESASLAGVAAGGYTLGIRPEGFDIAREPLEGSVPMVVGAVEYTGSDTYAFGKSPMGDLTVKIAADFQAVAETLHTGETLHVKALADGWHLFDSSGERVTGG